MPTRSFAALHLDVELSWQEEALTPMVEALVGTYAPAGGAPTLRYRLDHGAACGVWRNEQPLRRADELIDLLPIVELDLYRCLAEADTRDWLLHAAAVARDDRALILAGPSGAGKTTLTLALLERGASYLSDESVSIDPDAKVTGLCRAVTLQHTDTPVSPPPMATVHETEMRNVEGELVRSRLVHPPASQRVHGALPVAAVVLLEHAPDESPRESRLSPADALEAIWPHSLRGTPEAFAVATRLVEAVPVVGLRTQTVAPAVDSLERLLQG